MLVPLQRLTKLVLAEATFFSLSNILEYAQERGYGQVALMSSLAGTIGLPGIPAYSGTKCAIRAYGEALRCHSALRDAKVP